MIIQINFNDTSTSNCRETIFYDIINISVLDTIWAYTIQPLRDVTGYNTTVYPKKTYAA